jgi:hypothetical protein
MNAYGAFDAAHVLVLFHVKRHGRDRLKLPEPAQ